MGEGPQDFITRRRRSKKLWDYLFPDGRELKDREHCAWINKLRIPPAWTEVRIALSSRAKLQATGRDVRGRLQYLYHPRFREQQEILKYRKLVTMGQVVAQAKVRLRRHMRAEDMPREQILACMLHLITNSYFRPGSHHYLKQNNSIGITTLQKRHVHCSNGTVVFEFLGKRQVKQRKEVRHPSVSRIIKQCLRFPGKFLFQYPHEKLGYKRVDQWELNDYIRQLTKPGYTAKDFRTWGGTLSAARELAKQGKPESKTQAKRMAAAAIKEVAHQLGNTPAVAKRSYVAPPLLQAFLQDGRTIGPLLEREDIKEKARQTGITLEEQALLTFLKNNDHHNNLKKAA